MKARSAGHNQGAQFLVRLPLAAAPAEAVTPRVSSADPQGRRRVLIVDDNEDAAQTLGALLAAQGHDVKVFFSARDALEAIQGGLPDVAFLDLNMPVMDGFALCRRLRALAGGRGVRIVAVTGMGRKEDHARSRDAGFDLHLTKPADPDVVLRIVMEETSGDANVVPFSRLRSSLE